MYVVSSSDQCDVPVLPVLTSSVQSHVPVLSSSVESDISILSCSVQSDVPACVSSFSVQSNVPVSSLSEGSNPSSSDLIPDLAPFTTANNQFKWGEIDGIKISADIDLIYSEIVHWRQNLFKIPSGRQGKSFVQEMAHLFISYREASAIEGVALKAAMILPAMILQKPFKTSKTKDHMKCMERRMRHWHEGNLLTLLEEG